MPVSQANTLHSYRSEGYREIRFGLLIVGSNSDNIYQLWYATLPYPLGNDYGATVCY